jgi:hypothetical protein
VSAPRENGQKYPAAWILFPFNDPSRAVEQAFPKQSEPFIFFYDCIIKVPTARASWHQSILARVKRRSAALHRLIQANSETTWRKK